MQLWCEEDQQVKLPRGGQQKTERGQREKRRDGSRIHLYDKEIMSTKALFAP